MQDNLVAGRRDKLIFYSPLNFIRKINAQKHTDLVVQSLQNAKSYDCSIEGASYKFYFEELSWDTDFFGIKTLKLLNVLFENSCIKKLSTAVTLFKAYVRDIYNVPLYIFIEIPSEDIQLIQVLTDSTFKLVETRLTYYNDQIQTYNNESRYPVRSARLDDVDNLRRVAAYMRNEYDRFHADITFDQTIADNFLSKYIEEAVKGFSDIVLVPNVENLPSDSFLTANYLEKYWKITGVKSSKMVLSAVSSETNKGWYVKLISEMSYHFKEKGVEVAFMNTQSTNRAVFRTWEKLGYKLGATTHILSKTLY